MYDELDEWVTVHEVLAETSAEYRPHSDLTERIIGCAIKVHTTMGPGFVESVYENALCIQLSLDGIPYKRQLVVSLTYEGQEVGEHRLDLLVDDKVVVELKAKDQVVESDRATTLSYLKATGKQVALILNFGLYKIDIKRFANTRHKGRP